MFEKIVEKILSPILSEYVEDFNAENMKIGLWSGEVVIKNVQLRKEIIKKLNLPFKLKYSRLGCLKMTIPWKSLGSSKIDIVIEGLQLLITQLPQDMWECKNTKIIEKRKQQLMSYCDSIIQDFMKKSNNSGKQDQGKGYFGSMVVKILDNIQVTIKDIHVRYEDEITQKYSFGVTLEELRVYTVNKKGEPDFIDRTKKQNQNEPLLKKLILSNLGIYWNQRSQFFRDPSPHADMLSNIARSNQPANPKMNYLILMSSNALLHQREAGKQYVEPEINLFIEFQQLKVKISNLQLQQIVTMSERLQAYMNEVKMQNRKKLTQQQMIAYHKQFIRLFPAFLQKKTTGEQNNKIESILQKMQIQNFTDGIKNYLQTKQKEKMIQQKIDKKKGWFSFSKPKQLTEDEMKEIQNFMKDNFGLETKVIKRPEDFYYIKVNFLLKLLNVTIANTKVKGKNQEGLTVSLQDIAMDFNLREGGYMLNFGIQDIKVDIYSKDPEKLGVQNLTNILKKMPERGTKKIGKYVKLQVVGSPLQKKHLDTELSLTTQQLLLEFDPRLLKVAKDFADIKVSNKNTQAALQAYGDIKNKVNTVASSAAQSIGKTQKKKNFLSLDVKISSINVLLFFDPTKTNADLWALNLGEMKIFSDPATLQKPQFSPDEPMQKYCLKTQKISMAHFQNKDSYFYVKSQGQSVNEREIVLNQLGADVEVELFQKPTTSRPSIQAKATLHNLDLNLSGSTYPALQKIGNCFSLPESVLIEEKKQIQKIKANEKAEIMKHTKKIGMIYEQSSSEIKKYIGVLSEGYLYLYQDKKDNQYTTYYYVRNSKMKIQKEVDISKKPFSLIIQNSVNKVVLGFDKQASAEQWVKVIKTLQTENQFIIKQAVDQGEKVQEQQKKPAVIVDPNNLNIEVITTIQRISVKTLLHADRKVGITISALSAHAKIHETKTIAKVSLKQISISDNIYNYKYKQLTNFLYSQSIQGKEKLIDISVQLLSQKNPAYNKIDTNVAVEVGKLVCNYKPQTVQNLMRFLIPKSEPVSKQLTMQDKKASTDSATHHDQSSEQVLKQRKLQKQESLKKQQQKTSIKLNLVVEQISIALVNRKSRTMFAKIGMDKFRLNFSQSNKKMGINGGIGELWLSDYSNYPNTIIEEREQYTQFVYIVETFDQTRDMITFDINILEYPNDAGKTMLIKAGLYDLSASYVQQPVLRLITYLTQQMLPSLSPSSDQTKTREPQIMLDTKPEQSTMDIAIDLENVLAIVKPRNGEQQSLELLIKKISVRNLSQWKPYIKDPASEVQKVLVETYQIKLAGLSIRQRFKEVENNLTNDLNIDLRCQLIQNTLYYVKTYGKRYQPGMRITCKLSPFFMKISHTDYNFIMKCLFWNITYDDNAEGYLFDPVLKAINKQTQAEHTQPMYCNVLIDRIILSVSESNVPVSVLLLGGLSLNLSLSDEGMRLVFDMKNLFGTHISPSQQPNISVEKGTFNLFGYERRLNTNELLKIDNLVDIYSVKNISQSTKELNIKIDPTKSVIFVKFQSNKFSDTFINVKIQNLKIAIQLKNLLLLSKLAIMESNIQPPKSTLVPNTKKKIEAPPPPNSGKTVINIEMNNFLGSLSDKTGKNYIVMQGQILVKLKMDATKTEDEVLAKFNNKQKNYIDVATHNIELRNFSLYFCNLNNLQNKRYILSPIRLVLIYSQQYRMAQDIAYLETDIDGQLEKMIIQCSVRDMLMINKIIQDNLQALAQNSKEKKQIKEDPKMEEPNKEVIKSQISGLRDETFQIDKKKVEDTVKKMEKKIKDRTRADVKMQPLQIRIVNDCNNNFMPVLNFILQESILLFSSDPIKSHIANSLTLKLDFFNPRSASWQPVIETFKLSLDVLTLASQYGSKTQIILSSTQIQELKQLKINASTQLVSSLLATIDIAKSQNKKIQTISNVNQIQVSPYIIENQTNHTITIERTLNDENSTIDLKPLFKGPVKLTDKAEDLNFIYNGQRYTISLQKFGIVAIQGLSDVHLYFKMQKLNRVLCFVNKLTVKNATFSQIYCVRFNEKKEKMEQYLLMEPDQSLPVEKDWYIQFSFNMKSFTQMKKASDMFNAQYVKSQTQKFRLSVNEKKLISGHSAIMIRAPFVILNCLPKNMDIQFISGGKQVSSKQIHAQGSHEVFANEDITNLKFKILCQGFYWSQQFWCEYNFLGRQCFLFLSDREKGGSSIKYIFEKDEKRTQFRLNVFCPAFIVSQVDTDLQIYANLQREQANRSIQKYYKLGGQAQFWRKDAQSQQQRSIDKRTLIGTQSGSKIRVCGRNCLVDFSQPISIKNIGVSQTRVVVETQVHGKTVSLFTVLGVDISLKKMALKADIYSRQITLRYRWIFFNNSPHKLMIKQQGGERFYYEIDKSEKKPFYFIVPQLKQKPKGLIFKTENSNQSLPVIMNDLGSIYFRLQTPQSYIYFKLNTQQVQSYLYYELTQVAYQHLPYELVVKSQKIEAYCPLFDKQQRKGGNPILFINQIPHQPYNLQLYVRLVGTSNHQQVTVEADNLNFKTKLVFYSGELQIFVVVYVIFNDSKKYIVIEQMKQDPEQLPEYEMQTINFKLQRISLSIIQNHTQIEEPYESFYLYLQNLQFIMLKTNKRTKYQAKLQFLQFDQDQPYNIPNPVIITPAKYKQFTSTDPKDKPKSIFNALIEMDNSFVKNTFINRIIIDVNDLVIKIGSPFIKLIMQIYKQYTDAAKAEDQYLIKNSINTWSSLVPPPEGSKTFIKSICLAPFTISISAQIRLNELDQQSVVVLGTILNALGVVITNIEDAPIVLDGIILNDCTDTMQGINNKLIAHYKNSVLKQLYKIFGSLNIIGNPVSLFRNISTGFKDLKEKPAEGFVEGPLEFGKGLAQGTSSLIAHSVGGALNSVEKVTGTIASGLAALTFDKQFEQRREREKMKKPKHVLQGLEKGGKAVFRGFSEGITGVFLKPYQNAQKQGALGFFKGVGQGITGLVVKPVTGVIDFASKTTQGLKNTALYLQDKPNENRIRYPRVLYTEIGMVKQYNEVDSKLLSIVRKNKYSEKYNLGSDFFVQSFRVGTQLFLVILQSAVVLIKISQNNIEWGVPLRQMKIKRMEDPCVIRIEGPPKNQQFWQKSVNESVRFFSKEDADQFQKNIIELKNSVNPMM